jgi:capsular polysaccharide transport system permease protein
MPDSRDSLPKGGNPIAAFGARRIPRHVPDAGEPDHEFSPALRRGQPEEEPAYPGIKSPGVHLPPLPQRKTKSQRGLLLSLLLCVVLPTTLVAIYYYFFAADQYVAEFKFAVMESSPVLPGIPPPTTATSPTAAHGGGGLPMMAGGASMMGGSSATMQNYVVTDYLLSRQVVNELQNRIKIRSLYDSPRARDDLWARFDQSLPMERFVRYWKRMVTATYDPITGLAVVAVSAFSPEEALLIANTMVALSEDLVNTIAKRPQLDSVRFAEGEVKRAEERLKRAREAMTEYRLQEGVIDPAGALSINIALIQTLRGQLVQLQADLASLISRQNPNSPAADTLRSRLAATKDQLTKIETEVSKDREGNRMLTEVVGRYERLDLERQYAQGAMVAAQQALDQTRANAAAQHLYLTPYVRPALAESATYPKRAQSVFIAALAFFGIWILGVMVVRSVREHF